MSTAVRYRARFGATRLISALAVIACAACLMLVAGCASQGPTGTPVGAGSVAPTGVTPSAVTVTVKDDSNGKSVRVGVGSRVELLLASSYWTVNGSSAPAVLRQDGGSTVLARPSTCPAIPGLGCQPVQTDFTAVAVGAAVVTADRTTCGEAMRCLPSQQHFAVTVVVQ